MEFEASGLLGASDKEEWDREGLFKAVDELCGLNGGQKHLGTSLNSLEPSPRHRHLRLPLVLLPVITQS
jgi:hypothetical protein